MSDLPSGWAQTTLATIVEILDSRRVPVNRKERDSRLGDVPYYGATGQVGTIDDHLFDETLVLLGEDGAPFLDPVKAKAYIVRGKSWVNNHAHVLRALPGATTPEFLMHQLNAIAYGNHVNGTTRPKLTQKSMRTIPLAIPPLPQQDRIVAAIEEHFSRLDAAEASLKSAQARRAVLSKQLIDAAWTQGWHPAALQTVLAEPLTNGRSVVTDPDGFPVLRLTALRDRRIDLSERKCGAWTAEAATRFLVRRNDFLVSRGNGSLALVGRGGLIDTDPDPVAFPDTLIRVRPLRTSCLPEYLALVWDSQPVRRRLESLARTTAGIYKVNQKMLEAIEVPLPTIAKQAEFVIQVQRRLATTDRLLLSLSTSLARSTSLRRSILAAAFSGQLVPQDPADEPASVLLERIAAERAAAKPPRRKRVTA